MFNNYIIIILLGFFHVFRISAFFFNVVKVMVLISLITGVYVFCKNVFGEAHNLWAGLGGLVTSFSVAYFLFRFWVWGDLCFDNGSILATIGTALGLIGVFAGAKFAEPEVMKLRMDLQEAYLDASLNCIGDKNIINKALMSCATAYPKEFLSLSNELAKTRYLTPTLSLADSVYHSSDDVKTDGCMAYYSTVSKQCQDSFVIFNIKHPEFARGHKK